MAAMTAHLLLFAAALASPPTDRGAAPSYSGARVEGRVAVRIVAGARIAASEAQDSTLPPLSDSLVRTPDGNSNPARLVEFQ
jgi:hypothetical protein